MTTYCITIKPFSLYTVVQLKLFRLLIKKLQKDLVGCVPGLHHGVGRGDQEALPLSPRTRTSRPALYAAVLDLHSTQFPGTRAYAWRGVYCR
jgi:hypothetical protein